jgi:valyl-tRNA synthetase
MDARLSTVVREVFITLFEQGLIYRGKRLINWDPVLMTAVSDLEVVNEEEDGFLWHIRYPLSDGSGALTVATTRPETMLGDSAVMVHPQDTRYQHLIGHTVRLPLCDRDLPIIADAYVDRNFGTGVVKVTPAHDFNDHAVGQRHRLAVRPVLNSDAKISGDAPERYLGLDRFEARAQIVADLSSLGLLATVQPHKLTIPRGDRSGAIIEPMLTDQWFVATTKPAPEGSLFPGRSIAEMALEVVEQGTIRFVPSNWASTYRNWLENIQDWTISRQLWWGHQIPAWYKADAQGEAIHDGVVFVARDEADARARANASGWSGPLVRDPDVLDTWFSSALVPFSTLAREDRPWDPGRGPDSIGLGARLEPALAQFLPSQVLVTGFDIIFFWVARMVMMTVHCTGKVPFETVYVHALVRDAEGQKMSKSKGNTLDPIDLIDGIALDDLIEKRTAGLMQPAQAKLIEARTRKEYPQGIAAFGSDALRFSFASLATPGRNINFDLKRCEGYRNFCNKLWNATRFVLIQVQGCNAHDCGFAPHEADACAAGGYMAFGHAERWIASVTEEAIDEIERGLNTFRFDLAAKTYYELVWNSFCDWYLELAKVNLQHPDPAFQRGARRTLLRTLDTILKLGHPFMPFITEALWQHLAPHLPDYAQPAAPNEAEKSTPRAASRAWRTLMQEGFPRARPGRVDARALAWMTSFREIVESCRQLRAEMALSPGQRIPLVLYGPRAKEALADREMLCALARLSGVTAASTLPEDNRAPVRVLDGLRLMFESPVDHEAERQRIARAIGDMEAELARCEAKLHNPSFVQRAPASVVAQERERHARFAARLDQLRQEAHKRQALFVTER